MEHPERMQDAVYREGGFEVLSYGCDNIVNTYEATEVCNWLVVFTRFEIP